MLTQHRSQEHLPSWVSQGERVWITPQQKLKSSREKEGEEIGILLLLRPAAGSGQPWTNTDAQFPSWHSVVNPQHQRHKPTTHLCQARNKLPPRENINQLGRCTKQRAQTAPPKTTPHHTEPHWINAPFFLLTPQSAGSYKVQFAGRNILLLFIDSMWHPLLTPDPTPTLFPYNKIFPEPRLPERCWQSRDDALLMLETILR